MAEPVAERPGERAVLDRRAARPGRRRSPGCRPGSPRARRAAPRARPRTPPSPRRRAARSRTCACSRTRSRRRCSPRRSRRARRPRSSGRSHVRAGGHRSARRRRSTRRRGRRPLLVEEPRQIPCDLALGAADELHLGEALEDAVGDRARMAEDVELALLLDRAQRLDEADRAARARARRPRVSGSRSRRRSLPRSRSCPTASRRAHRSTPRFVCTTSTPSTARAASM